jgi:DNA-binding beta-propeller fold protein YncE
MMRTKNLVLGCMLLAVLLGAACNDGGDDKPDVGGTKQDLLNRAYIVSLESDEITVIDLNKMEIMARIPSYGVANHMGELNGDYTKFYVDSSKSDKTMVIDVEHFKKVGEIETGKHPTHLSLSLDKSLMAVALEEENAIAFIDTKTDTVKKKLPGFYLPHFMRFSPEGRYGYVANLEAHHITRVDLRTLEIDKEIVMDGFKGSPNPDMAPNEGGFGDCQINQEGMLFAAHSKTGQVLAYDTLTQEKKAEIKVGLKPWIVYADHPFLNVPMTHLVPNFGSRDVSMIDGLHAALAGAERLPGDEEAYGVNYNSESPSIAYVMNRVRKDVAMVDITQGKLLKRIEVGGNTETASTTADGKWIVAAVSSANKVVVIDAKLGTIAHIFNNVGKYPWSVTIPRGQNYCH